MNLPMRGSITGIVSDNPRISEVATPSRITVVETVTYSLRNDQPTVVQSRFGRSQETDEQTFIRRTKVSEQWIGLDVGWITVCGMMILQNDEGKSFLRIPTPDQLAEVNKRIIEVAVLGGEEWPFLLPPGESMRVTPSNLSKIVVRCQSGEAKLIINLIPG